MLDQYIWGKVTRISPEAPVPIFRIKERSECLGGAGNVSANLAGLGCNVTVIGVCGNDSAGVTIQNLLKQKTVKNCLTENNLRPTITKTRVIAQGQQLMRLDEENSIAFDDALKNEILNSFYSEILNHQIVIISDYGKGLFQSSDLCQMVIKKCRQLKIPVFVDPKGNDWGIYKGATCITPNSAELKLIANISGEKSLNVETAIGIRKKFEIDWLLVTQGPKGMWIIDNNDSFLEIPSVAREVFDVSGAGDTVIATLSAGVASGLNFKDAAKIANMAAGIVVGKIGTQPITQKELAVSLEMSETGSHGVNRLQKILSIDSASPLVQAWRSAGEEIVFTNGCFDLLHPGHIHLLHQAKEQGNRLVVGMNSDSSVRRLKGEGRPILSENDRSVILAALTYVDLVVIFEEDTPLTLIDLLRPDILVKGNDYTPDTVVGRDVVASYGGKICIVSLLENYSTTGITKKWNIR